MSSTLTTALQGTLDDFNAADVLGLLETTHQTGALVVAGEASGTLWLADGSVYYGEIAGGVPLNEAIVRSGLVTEAAWDSALDRADTDGLLEAIVAQGGCNREALYAILSERIIDAVFELLVLSKSRFEFVPGDGHALRGAPGHDVASLVAESRRRLERWREVAAVIPSTAVVVRLAAALPPTVPSLTLEAEEFRVLAAVDGGRTVAEITRVLGASAFTVCGILHRLVTLGACCVSK